MYFVYILTNKNNTTLYTGVTSDLVRRVFEHKSKVDKKSFTARYNLNKLVFFEYTSQVEFALEREKQIKKASRKRKEQWICEMNPSWEDLSLGW